MIYTVSNGSGGSPNVLIKTETGATVTLSKGDIVLTKIAENGEALFESVDYGTWTAKATLGDKSTSIQVVVNETIEEEINMGLMLSSLPLKTTKLKIGGIKWILFTRDHAGYPSGSQTLISEYTVGANTSFGSNSNYLNSKLQSRMQSIYESFGEHEKAYVLETTRKYKDTGGAYPTFNEYVFPLTSVEVGGNTDAQMGSNIGFTGNADRICTIENGAAQSWWLANASLNFICYVNSDGSANSSSLPSGVRGVRPAMNLSANTIITTEPDAEGYYFIKGAEETTELLLSRALNALSILGVKQ